MKRITVILLVIVLICALCGCNTAVLPSGTGDGGNAEGGEHPYFGGMTLPEKIGMTVDGERMEADISWSDSGCSYEINGSSCKFTYDAEKRELKATVTEGDKTVDLEKLCSFDDEGRIISLGFRGETVLEFAYPDNVMTVTKCFEREDGFTMALEADMVNRRVSRPPFNQEDLYLTFTEKGDLIGDTDDEVFTYQYDSDGNTVRIGSAREEGSAITLTYSDTPMTALWQRVPVKLAMVYYFGASYAVICMDQMCMGLNYNYAISQSK